MSWTFGFATNHLIRLAYVAWVVESYIDRNSAEGAAHW